MGVSDVRKLFMAPKMRSYQRVTVYTYPAVQCASIDALGSLLCRLHPMDAVKGHLSRQTVPAEGMLRLVGLEGSWVFRAAESFYYGRFKAFSGLQEPMVSSVRVGWLRVHEQWRIRRF